MTTTTPTTGAPAAPAKPTITQDIVEVATAAAKGAAAGVLSGGWMGAIIAGGISGVEELMAILASHPEPTLEISAATDGLTAAHAVLTAAATAQAAPGATTATVLAAAQAAAIPAAEGAVEAVVGDVLTSGHSQPNNGTGDVKGKDVRY